VCIHVCILWAYDSFSLLVHVVCRRKLCILYVYVCLHGCMHQYVCACVHSDLSMYARLRTIHAIHVRSFMYICAPALAYTHAHACTLHIVAEDICHTIIHTLSLSHSPYLSCSCTHFQGHRVPAGICLTKNLAHIHAPTRSLSSVHTYTHILTHFGAGILKGQEEPWSTCRFMQST
jgi:hypothetical protein